MDVTYLTSGEAARRLGVPTWRITDLYTRGLVSDRDCPVQSGRRMIPERLLPVLAMQLRRLGVQVRREVSRG